MSKTLNLKISVSGVRGMVGESLTPALISDFAAAFGECVGGGRVIVGRDTRPTGPMLEHAVVAGLLSVGCQPVLVGVAPTPTVQMVVDQQKANGGIMISASHNPVEWNALKFVGPSGIFLNFSEAAELLDIYNQPGRRYVREEEYRKVRTVEQPFALHQQRIFSKLDVEAIRRARPRVAVDCCNGAGAPFVRSFLEDLGCEVFTLFDRIDVPFQRKPEPVPENLTEISKLIVEKKCAIGFAQDPDADRVVVLDSTGRAIGEQYSVVLATEAVLSKTPGPVAVNIQTTKSIVDVAKKHGCEVFFTPVGEINVTSKMLAIGAVIGGEGGSGGVIWPSVHPCRDSFTGMALVLEMMSRRQQSIETILADIPHYHSAGGKVVCSAGKAVDVVQRLREKYASASPNTIDGLRLDWDDGWVLIRASNTEPIMRVFAEARTPERAQALNQQFMDEIKS